MRLPGEYPAFYYPSIFAQILQIFFSILFWNVSLSQIFSKVQPQWTSCKTLVACPLISLHLTRFLFATQKALLFCLTLFIFILNLQNSARLLFLWEAFPESQHNQLDNLDKHDTEQSPFLVISLTSVLSHITCVHSLRGFRLPTVCLILTSCWINV